MADYNWITPDQYNDMHNGLSGGFAGLTGDAANIRQGDNALSRLVPLIMSSKAYKDGGVIILWWDESESNGVSGDNPDDFNHTIGEIIISPLAHENENGLPYASSITLPGYHPCARDVSHLRWVVSIPIWLRPGSPLSLDRIVHETSSRPVGVEVFTSDSVTS